MMTILNVCTLRLQGIPDIWLTDNVRLGPWRKVYSVELAHKRSPPDPGIKPVPVNLVMHLMACRSPTPAIANELSLAEPKYTRETPRSKQPSDGSSL